jgi:hypothetical protein
MGAVQRQFAQRISDENSVLARRLLEVSFSLEFVCSFVVLFQKQLVRAAAVLCLTVERWCSGCARREHNAR